VTAILHDDDFFVVALHIRQGFRQDLGLLKRRHVHEGTPLPVRLFSRGNEAVKGAFGQEVTGTSKHSAGLVF
jgi:hypothetical protein